MGSGGRLDAAAALDALDLTDPISQASAPAATNSTSISVGYTDSDVGKGVDKVDLYAKAPGDSDYSPVATDSSPSASGSFTYIGDRGRRAVLLLHTRDRQDGQHRGGAQRR